MTLPDTLAPLLTTAPDAFVTWALLKAGSSFCVNQSVTAEGEDFTVLPTRGSEWSRVAWALACVMAIGSANSAAMMDLLLMVRTALLG